MKMMILECIAVLAGAVLGTVLTGLLAWLFAGTPFVVACLLYTSPSPRD